MGVFQVVWPKVLFEFKKDSAFRICCYVFSFHGDFLRWPAPLYNLYFDSFLLICTSFVVRTRGIVCVVYLLSRQPRSQGPLSTSRKYPGYGWSRV